MNGRGGQEKQGGRMLQAKGKGKREDQKARMNQEYPEN